MAEPRGRTIRYGDRPGVDVDYNRDGLPDDCPCPAVSWCGRPPEITWPEPDCPHHGRAAYGLSQERNP